MLNILSIIAPTTSQFQCPAGSMPNEFDKWGSDFPGISYNIELVNSDSTTEDVSKAILRPITGRGLCRRGSINLVITLTPAPRSADMFISLKAKAATSVTFKYTGSVTSAPYTVRVIFIVKEVSDHQKQSFCII